MNVLVRLLGLALCIAASGSPAPGSPAPGSSPALSPSTPLVPMDAGGRNPDGNAPVDRPPPSVMLDVSWDAPGLLTGRVASIGVRAAVPLAAVEASLDARAAVALPVSHDGTRWLVLAPVSVEADAKPAPLSITATLPGGRKVLWSKPVPIVEAHYEERSIRVAKRFTAPSRKQRIRAERESRILSVVLDTTSSERLWRGSFARPTAGGETSPFGTRRTYNRKRKSRHLGLDLDGDVGAAIVAANSGRVVLAAERFYSGGTVVLDHGQGLFTMYFHMSRIDVKPDEIVPRGAPLGAVGATGQVTGPHLHFSVRLGGLYQDPRHLLALDLSADTVDVARSTPTKGPAGGPPDAGITDNSVPGEPRKAVP